MPLTVLGEEYMRAEVTETAHPSYIGPWVHYKHEEEGKRTEEFWITPHDLRKGIESYVNHEDGNVVSRIQEYIEHPELFFKSYAGLKNEQKITKRVEALQSTDLWKQLVYFKDDTNTLHNAWVAYFDSKKRKAGKRKIIKVGEDGIKQELALCWYKSSYKPGGEDEQQLLFQKGFTENIKETLPWDELNNAVLVEPLDVSVFTQYLASLTEKQATSVANILKEHTPGTIRQDGSLIQTYLDLADVVGMKQDVDAYVKNAVEKGMQEHVAALDLTQNLIEIVQKELPGIVQTSPEATKNGTDVTQFDYRPLAYVLGQLLAELDKRTGQAHIDRAQLVKNALESLEEDHGQKN